MSEHWAETTCVQRFDAAGSGGAGFSGALNDPAISLALNTLSCNLHTASSLTLCNPLTLEQL